MPAHVKVSDDTSRYYMKAPHEMSRHEIAELEMLLKELDEPDVFIPEEVAKATPEYQEMKRQMRMIQPVRYGVILRYFRKYKY